MFLSDVHVGEYSNTWDAVEAAFKNFRGENPNARYLVYAGDSIKHGSASEEAKADQYIQTIINLAFKYGFPKENIYVAQGNNDGPHDHPFSSKWASAVANSGVVPDSDKSTCQSASYYSKCSADVCGLVINTDLEVYGTGAEDDKLPFRGNLSDEEVQFIFDSKQDQHNWARAKVKYFMSSGKKFFMVGHHPELANFFDPSWASQGFLGAIGGHIHTFYPTDSYKGKKMLTLLPGYTSHSSPHGYAQSSLLHQIHMDRSVLVHYDYGKHRFYHDGGSYRGSQATAVRDIIV